MKTGMLKQALLEPMNAGVLLLCLIAAAMMESTFPLLLGIVWEIGFLLTAPQSEWFQKRFAARTEALEQGRRLLERQELRRKLTAEQEKRFERLLKLSREVRAGAAKAEDDTCGLLTPDLIGLDGLAHSFLKLLVTRRRYQERADELQPEKLECDAAEARQRLEKEQAPEVRRILEQNLELLEKRRAASPRVATGLRALDAQLDAIENTFRLLADTVISLRAAPNTLTNELASMVAEVEVTEQILRETAPALEEIQRLTRRMGRA